MPPPFTRPLQLKIKEDEIAGLRQHVAQLQGIRLKTEVNLASQEALILSLQLRQEVEKEAKFRTVHVLAERSKALAECSRQQQQLEEGLSICRRDQGVLEQVKQGGNTGTGRGQKQHF